MEIIGLQDDNALKSSFEKKPLIELWITSPIEIQKCQRICKKNVCAVCINIQYASKLSQVWRL